MVKLFTALVVGHLISAPGHGGRSPRGVRVGVVSVLARMTSTTMQIETFADMLFSEAQMFPVIVPAMVTSAETAERSTRQTSRSRVGYLDARVAPVTARRAGGPATTPRTS